MGNLKPERASSLLRARLRKIRDDGAGGALRSWARLLPLLFLSALALWFAVSGVGSHLASAAVTNRGFETGNLNGWSTGTVSESVTVVGNDTIASGVVASPLEGNYMARLGESEPSADESQPMGPNELYQDFTITENALRFAYNIWTYDYTGYDEFSWEVRLTDTDTVIGTDQTQAWGLEDDISRKTSGWRIVQINTSGYQGQSVRVSFSARGTIDQRYAFWVYIDSAEEALASGVIDYSGIKVNGFSPSQSSQTQTIFLAGRPSTGNNTIAVPIVCPDGKDPTGADLIVSGPDSYLQTYAMTKDGGTIWEVTFPTPPGTEGDTFTLTLRINCGGTIITVTIGSLTLIDPSGFVTDAVTSAAIPGATVTLQRLDGSTWADANPYETAGDPPSPKIKPQVNPQLTDGDGHYGWDVAAGTYRVVVEKEGYATQTSASVVIPPPVTNLNIQLVPAAAGTRTLEWGPGWHNAVWTGGASTPEEAFTCAEGKYAVAYRYTAGGWQGYFPALPGSSTMTSLAQYDAFLILITQSVTCDMPVEAAPGASRTLEWAVGWQNAGWTGADGTSPAQAFACAAGKYAAAYRYTASGFQGYFPTLLDGSTMTSLDQYDAFFILVTAPVSCSMSIGGAPAPGPTPTQAPTPTHGPTPSPTPTHSPTPTATPTAEDFELVEALTALNVDEWSEEPIGETDDFDETDPYVYVWMYFEHITVPELCVQVDWYLPDDSLYDFEEYCLDGPPEPGEWEAAFWFWYPIAGWDWADIHGEYTVDISVDSGDGYEYLTSLHFTIS
ncbi:MAG: carboxypeptidase-like regulatory domain-containing protein [Dehalococcoidia bacterium]|nr:carboxypeptidase-like regulatory domain-containing protein [Dehalococcoidia bacterium]